MPPKKRDHLPPGYANVAVNERPVNDTPLQVVMDEQGLTDFTAGQDTGIAFGLIRYYRRNQVIPGLIHALRLEHVYNIPCQAWLATVLGQLMWDHKMHDSGIIKANLRRKWKEWAKRPDANGMNYNDRRRAAYAELKAKEEGTKP